MEHCLIVDPYSTHLEALVAAAIESRGDILELGCGDYSSPILAAIARHHGGKLLIKSSSREWADRFRHLAEVEIVNWETCSIDGKYGMIFIDSEEHHEGRMTKLIQLKDHAPIIVMHDANSIESDSRWSEIIKLFKTIRMYKTYSPWTVVLKKC